MGPVFPSSVKAITSRSAGRSGSGKGTPMQQNAPRVTVDQFRPRSMVRLRETEVLRARYPAIDAHNHFRDDMDVEETVANMDACNVRAYIDLSGWNGDRLKRRLDRLKGRYPERFAVF